MRCFFVFAWILLATNGVWAQNTYFEFTPKAKKAYHQVLSLRFEEARQSLQDLHLTEPGNLIFYHIENYLDFFTVYIREDYAEFQRLERNKDARIEQFKLGPKDSPYYLYLQANVRLHWALARLKFEEYYTAFLEVNKAFKLLIENERLFPDFLPNKKDLGILHAMVGTIPDNYKWGVELLTSLRGTIDQGRSEIESVIQYASRQPFIYEQETLVLYAYLLMHLDNDAEGAWDMLNSGNLDPQTNALACFTLANIAMRTGRNDEAIRLLANRPRGSAYFPFPYMDFMLGVAKLRRLDADADQPINRFLKNFSGRHFIKEAYQKLSWHNLIFQNGQRYNEYRQMCLRLGYQVVGSDDNAQEEALSNFKPHVSLLKARLLFDGGYYQRAYNELKSKRTEDFSGPQHQLEFTYRMGRILHKMKRTNEAIRFYEKTIATGKNEPFYYACNAALQSGLLFEEIGNLEAARQQFRLCLKINPAEHRTGLHQQAKAGLERLSQ